MKINYVRRLPLEGSPNTRDLGGYPCAGGSTRWGVFLRSASPHEMTPGDVQTLRNYGIANTIDLRRDDECEAYPSMLEGAKDFTAFHVSMSDYMDFADFAGDLPGSMSGLYISLMDNVRYDIATVLRHMAGAKGGVLFHCAVGKDRTGVIAMLLLKLAGVEDADVVADYSVTDIYMREIFGATLENAQPVEIPPEVMRSIPDSMWRVLQHLNDTYGNVQDYLLGSGMTTHELSALREKLVNSL